MVNRSSLFLSISICITVSSCNYQEKIKQLETSFLEEQRAFTDLENQTKDEAYGNAAFRRLKTWENAVNLMEQNAQSMSTLVQRYQKKEKLDEVTIMQDYLRERAYAQTGPLSLEEVYRGPKIRPVEVLMPSWHLRASQAIIKNYSASFVSTKLALEGIINPQKINMHPRQFSIVHHKDIVDMKPVCKLFMNDNPFARPRVRKCFEMLSDHCGHQTNPVCLGAFKWSFYHQPDCLQSSIDEFGNYQTFVNPSTLSAFRSCHKESPVLWSKYKNDIEALKRGAMNLFEGLFDLFRAQ